MSFSTFLWLFENEALLMKIASNDPEENALPEPHRTKEKVIHILVLAKIRTNILAIFNNIQSK